MEKDLLARSNDCDRICDLIRQKFYQMQGLTLAINGSWGCGKSFLLKMIENKLNNEAVIFHYDCWANDYYEDPLIGIMSVIAQKLNKLEEKDASNENSLKKCRESLTKIVSSFVESKCGVNVKDILNAMASSGLAIANENFNPMLNFEEALEKIKTLLSEQDVFQAKKILFVVDELDRCLPEYAIKVLNRLHHICENSRFILVLAINREELLGSINLAYGRILIKDEFGERYLNRFIEASYELGEGLFADKELALWSNFVDGFNPEYIDKAFFAKFCKNALLDLSIREKKRIIQRVIDAHRLVSNRDYDGKMSLAVLCAELLFYRFRIAKEYGYLKLKKGPFANPCESMMIPAENDTPSSQLEENVFSIAFAADDDKSGLGIYYDLTNMLITGLKEGETESYDIPLDSPANRVKALFAQPPLHGDYRDEAEGFYCSDTSEMYKLELATFRKFKIILWSTRRK